MLLIFLTIHTIYSFQYVYIFAVQLYMNYENLSPATLSYFNDSVWSEYLPCMVVTSSRSHYCSVVISFQFLDIHQLECTVCQLCGILCYRCQVSVHTGIVCCVITLHSITLYVHCTYSVCTHGNSYLQCPHTL